MTQKTTNYNCDKCGHNQAKDFNVCPICRFNHETKKHEYKSSFGVEHEDFIRPIRKNSGGLI